MVATSTRSERCPDESPLLLMSMCLDANGSGQAMNRSISYGDNVATALGSVVSTGSAARSSLRPLAHLVDEPGDPAGTTEPPKVARHGIR